MLKLHFYNTFWINFKRRSKLEKIRKCSSLNVEGFNTQEIPLDLWLADEQVGLSGFWQRDDEGDLYKEISLHLLEDIPFWYSNERSTLRQF